MKKNATARAYGADVSTKVLNILIEFLQQVGNPTALDLRELMLDTAAESTMSVESWFEILERVYALYPCPDLGLQIGRHVQLHHIGLLGYVLLNCGTVEQALIRLNRFEPLLQNVIPSMLERYDDCVTIYWVSDFRSTLMSDQVGLAGFFTGLRTLVDDANFTAHRIQTIHPKPNGQTLYDELFDCPIEFNASRESITFTTEQLSCPIKTADPHLIVILEQQANAVLQANDLLQLNTPPDEWLVMVQKHIATALKDGNHCAAVLANRMGLSERSFFRYLRYRNVRRELNYELQFSNRLELNA